MSIKYLKIKRKPTTFNRLFGLSVCQFETIFSRVDDKWQKKILAEYKRSGRDYKLEVAEMLLISVTLL